MNPENAALVEFIREEIRRTGPISFARFMEQALYHPELGYYSSDRALLGREGDYFTNVSVGPAFGQLFAGQFAEIWKIMGEPQDFVLVEQGAHHGEFARDVLEALRNQEPKMFAALRYRVIEPFPLLRKRQQVTLAEFRDQVGWCESIDSLDSFQGVHFSNELLDALPVHLVSARVVSDALTDFSWMERRVALDHDRFVFREMPMTDEALRAAATQLPVRYPSYETEINLAAPKLVRDLFSKLSRGFVVAVDYGFSRERFYEEERTTGTLQARARHTLIESPLVGVGHSDITAHVEWSSLVEKAEAAGFVLRGLCDQHHFLTGLLAASPAFAADSSAKTRRALQTLLHPEMLGRKFQVLVLSKNMSGPALLSGLKFARAPRSAL